MQLHLCKPQGIQWFKISQAGSYSIRTSQVVSGERVDFDVYHHTDLSRPMQPFDEEPNDWGLPFSLPDPPYFANGMYDLR